MTKKFEFQLIGSDPEFICRDKDTNLPVSMVEIVQENLGDCYVYPDNVLLEMNHEPVTLDEFPAFVEVLKSQLTEFLERLDLTCTLGEVSAEYPQTELCNKMAHAIGCMPFEVAGMSGVPFTPRPYQDNWRYAGGHIHLAYDKNLIPSHVLVRLLDKALKDHDVKDIRRDYFYGQRGAYREKSYGIEYRAVSNAWMSNPTALIASLKEIENQINEVLQ